MMRARILYALLLAAAGYFAVFYGDRASFIFLYALLLLLAFSLLTVLLAPFFIEIRQRVEKSFVFKNEPLAYEIEVIHKGIFHYPQIHYQFFQGDFIRYEKDDQGEASANRFGITESAEDFTQKTERGKMGAPHFKNGLTTADGKTMAHFRITFPFRGEYPVGVRKVRVMDFLGIFQFSFSIRGFKTILVYPEKLPDFSVELKNDLMNKALSGLELYNDSYAELSDVRKYTPSDDYKKIHWKLTAKRNELIVKNHQSAALNKTFLFLDTQRLPMKEAQPRLVFEDRVTAYAVSALSFSLLNRRPVEMIYGPAHEDYAQIHSSEALDGAYRLLAKVRFHNAPFLVNALERMLQDNGFYNLLVFLFEMDKACFDCLKDIGAFGHNVTVFYFYTAGHTPDSEREGLLQGLRETGMSVEKISVA